MMQRTQTTQGLRTMTLGSLLALTGHATAQQLDWGFISTTGDPDPITVFDLANPGGSNSTLGFVDGNFNRGMDFDTADTFYYYVSTDALNQPGDRGLWRWDNGTNTQLFNTPFSDSGDGDATLSEDNTIFYVSTDNGVAPTGDSIYAFENLNGAVTFTEIGETGLSQLIGLAVHPVTGVMYGYDSSSEALYTIDRSNAVPTFVGGSGLSLAAIGGMDFNEDGSVLLLTSGRTLYSVSTSDGALTLVGDLILNTSALSFRGFGGTPVCVGDIADDFGTLGSDGQVSFGDFLALLGLIGPCPGGNPGCTGDIADDFGTLGSDGQVSFGDFLALLGVIGPCP